MNENIPTNEGGAEKFPNEREVLNLFEEIIEGDFEIVRSLEDEHSLYVLEVQVEDEEGNVVQYKYAREGKNPERTFINTTIDAIYFDADGSMIDGQQLMRYMNGEWVKT